MNKDYEPNKERTNARDGLTVWRSSEGSQRRSQTSRVVFGWDLTLQVRDFFPAAVLNEHRDAVSEAELVRVMHRSVALHVLLVAQVADLHQTLHDVRHALLHSDMQKSATILEDGHV